MTTRSPEKELVQKVLADFRQRFYREGVLPTTVPGKQLFTSDVEDFLRAALSEAWEAGKNDHTLTMSEVASTEANERNKQAFLTNVIGQHNARILNQYQHHELGDERILWPPITKATEETLAALLTTPEQKAGEQLCPSCHYKVTYPTGIHCTDHNPQAGEEETKQ